MFTRLCLHDYVYTTMFTRLCLHDYVYTTMFTRLCFTRLCFTRLCLHDYVYTTMFTRLCLHDYVYTTAEWFLLLFYFYPMVKCIVKFMVYLPRLRFCFWGAKLYLHCLTCTGVTLGQWMVKCHNCTDHLSCEWTSAVWQPHRCRHPKVPQDVLKKCLAGRQVRHDPISSYNLT